MKRLYLTFAAILCAANFSHAQSIIEVDGISYKIIKEADEANTHGLVHVCPKPYGQYEDAVIIPNAIFHGSDEYADIYKVVGIAPETFANTEYLESVALPPSIESIGEDAFYNSSLTNITIPYGNLKSIPEGVFYCSSLESIHLPKSITEIGATAFSNNNRLKSVVVEGVIHLGNGAFRSCTDLETVKLPETLVTIGDHAFDRCLDLIQINFPSSLKSIGCHAFQECKELKEVQFPKGLIEIKKNAFNNSGLTSIKLPDGLTRIDEGTFICCDNLKTITIPGSVKRIGNFAFSACTSLHDIILPENLKTIGGAAFYNCNELEAIYLNSPTPPAIGKIEDNEEMSYPFAYCSELLKIYVPAASLGAYKRSEQWKGYADKLVGFDYSKTSPVIGTYKVTRIKPNQYAGQQMQSFTIPDGIEEIGEAAFYNCADLTKVNIPNSVKTIKYSAFYQCIKLKDINLPRSIQTIENAVFADCESLEKIVIPNGITLIDEYLFNNCRNLKEVTLPNTIKTIGESAFANCSALESIIIPEGVTAIDDIAFEDCKNLKKLVLPSTLESIGYRAFGGCESLTEVILPSSLEYVGQYAFARCEQLNKVTIEGTGKEWERYIFTSCPNLKAIEISCDISEFNPDSFYDQRNLIKKKADVSSIVAVDLGLSVKWANMNLNADFPDDKGDLFSWGSTLAGDTFGQESYKFYKNGKFIKYCVEDTYGTVDGRSKLIPQDDAATSILGQGWAIPTEEEWKELIEKCEWKFECNYGNSASGFKITGPSGNHIFIPTTEYSPIKLWSADLGKSFLGCTPFARIIIINSSKVEISNISRYMGLPIRPVKRK